jgi:hypothetical protein
MIEDGRNHTAARRPAALPEHRSGSTTIDHRDHHPLPDELTATLPRIENIEAALDDSRPDVP